MNNMNGDSANRFISALVKSLQTLCHGYVDFNDGIEIIGHLYLNIDSGPSYDYILKEKVCKNAENGTIFVSKSFQAHAPPGEVISRKGKEDELVFEDSSLSPTNRIQSAISNMSNVFPGQLGQKSHPSHHQSSNTGKRKKDHGDNYSMQPPYKYTTLQSTSSSSGYFNSGSSSKAGDRNHSEHFSNSSHAEFFGGDSNQGSGMGADDEDDLDLDVTFVKEEYQRNSGQRGVASRLSQDAASSQSNVLHEGQLSYPSNHGQAPQQFASGTAGELGGLNQNFQDPSQLDLGQQPSQGPPNPRNNVSGNSSKRPTFRVPAVPVKVFRCPVCGIAIRHKNNIKRHMRRHNALLALHGGRGHTSASSPVSVDIFDSSVSPRASHSNTSPKPKTEELLHTMRQTKWAVTKAREWLSHQGMNVNFEDFTDEQLDQMLLGFYTSGMKKDGSSFSATALLAFRTALNRYMQKRGRSTSIATSHSFKQSNAVLSRLMATAVRTNKTVRISDIKLMYTSRTLSNTNPESLLYKVWFELQMHFRSKIDWSRVLAEHFFFSHNALGRLSVTWNTCGLGNCQQMTVLESVGGPYCHVESLRQYMEHRNVSGKHLLQTPASKELQAKGVWYLPEELREYREKTFMKKISAVAKLSQTYTNACVANCHEEYYQAMLVLNSNRDPSDSHSKSAETPRRPEPFMAGPSRMELMGKVHDCDNALAGPPPRMPDGVKPLCGYVHTDDAKKWMMFELVPASGIYIHQENYNVAMSKMRQDRPDGKAMTRYLMSCFWRQSDLVGASIAEPPKPHQRSLDRGIVHAIVEFCTRHSHELATDIRRTIQQKIGYARFYFMKKAQDPDLSPKTTPASISVEASPRRMSMEMARREAGSLILDQALKLPVTGSSSGGGSKRGRRASGGLVRTLSESDEGTASRMGQRQTPELLSRSYSDTGRHTSDDSLPPARLGPETSSIISVSSVSDMARRMSADLASRLPANYLSRGPVEPAERGVTGDLPDDPSDLSTGRASDQPGGSRMTTEALGVARSGLEASTSNARGNSVGESNMGETLAGRASLPANVPRGFLDMLNFYPNN